MYRFRFLIIATVGLFIAVGALSSLAQVDHNPKFIPLCSKADLYPDATECIPDESVAKQAKLRLWNYASRQLWNCGLVVLDPDESPNDDDNLVFDCGGMIGKFGVIPYEDVP